MDSNKVYTDERDKKRKKGASTAPNMSFWPADEIYEALETLKSKIMQDFSLETSLLLECTLRFILELRYCVKISRPSKLSREAGVRKRPFRRFQFLSGTGHIQTYLDKLGARTRASAGPWMIRVLTDGGEAVKWLDILAANMGGLVGKFREIGLRPQEIGMRIDDEIVWAGLA
ncbi:MAG: hypothetical protein Q9212_001543 [Teloschistes hypoglaucus]